MRSHFWLMWGILILAVFFVAHSEPLKYRTIYVRLCDGRTFANIYESDDLRNSLPNPFTSEANGNYTFATNAACVKVEEKERHGK